MKEITLLAFIAGGISVLIATVFVYQEVIKRMLVDTNLYFSDLLGLQSDFLPVVLVSFVFLITLLLLFRNVYKIMVES